MLASIQGNLTSLKIKINKKEAVSNLLRQLFY